MTLPFHKDKEEKILDIGRRAASFIQEHFNKKENIAEETKEHDNSLVSFVDRETEQMITHELTDLFSEFGFITEEDTVLQADDREYYWIVDPLDGTTNFLHGLEEFSISIGLSTSDHQIIWGMVIDVMKKDEFLASRDGGAWKNGRKLELHPTPLHKALIATGFPYYRFEHKQDYLRHFEGFMGACRGMRRCGSAALDLVHVAEGVFGGFFEYNLHLWDVAAGALIVEEAGGIVTDFEGDPEKWKRSGHIVAGEKTCYMEMMEVIRR